MKQMSYGALCTFAMLSSTAALAAEETYQTNPVIAEESRRVALQQLPDPARFADDLCWVAPEWRDD